MFSYKRAERVKEVLQQEIASIIRDEVKDIRIGFVTVTEVYLTDNLRSAKIYISPMGTEEQKRNTIKGIHSAAKFIRSQLGKRMRIKHLPELSFILDTIPENSDRINLILHKIENDKKE